MTEKIHMTIDGKACEASAGTTVFEAARGLGIDIPHFCYHPKLSIAGNCRLCQVEIEGAKGPVISCRERVREGMVVRVHSQKAVQTRRDVLEYILINHPLDCPVCDQSGECKLQDQYFSHSLQASRMKLPKVLKPKMKKIGPEVMLDDERCVLCTRCVRFCDEIVGEHQLLLRERGDHSTIDIAPGKQLDNAYSLCTVDICPVGALTSIDFRFKKRVWFLKSTKSICTGCATGCNIWLDHADRMVYRYRPRDNEKVNQCWMCDAGRATYKPINSEARCLFPMVKQEGQYVRVTWKEAMEKVHELFSRLLGDQVTGVLSATWSQEENIAFWKIFSEVLRSKCITWNGLPHEPAFADRILRDADRNPNTNGVKMLSDIPFDPKMESRGLVILGTLPTAQEKILEKHNRDATLWITDVISEGTTFADVILPRATHAEQEGVFINRMNMQQRFEKAFAPKGESLPGWQVAARLARAFGSDIRFHSASEIFEGWTHGAA